MILIALLYLGYLLALHLWSSITSICTLMLYPAIKVTCPRETLVIVLPSDNLFADSPGVLILTLPS
jgi:hypothetical protein